jgi:large subunit ribosomal protein L15
MNLHDVNAGIKKNKRRKRVGRGPGSGHGKTSGRGHKGQGALAGWSASPIFEGGASPLIRRIPKRGFHNQWGDVAVVVNVGQLEALFDAGADVTPEALKQKNLAKGRYDVLKILGNGELKKKLKITAHSFSASALEKIKAAGGEIVTLSRPKPVVKLKAADRVKPGDKKAAEKAKKIKRT